MNIVTLPVFLPLITAALMLAFIRRPALQRAISFISGLLLIGVCVNIAHHTTANPAEIFVVILGDWLPHTGIVWVIDALSGIMLVLTSITSFACLAYSSRSSEAKQKRHDLALHHFLLVGVNGCFVTGDLFNLFVFFEIMLLTSFVQINLGTHAEASKKTFPYVTVNLLASMIFLIGVGFIYASVGTVNLAEVANLCAKGTVPWTFWLSASLLLLVFVLKAGLAPLFFWLPDSYPSAQPAVSALLAGLLTKVGIYTLFCVVPLLFGPERGLIHDVFLALAGVTMVAGVMGALGRNDVRSILSFHIVSQVGYMVFGLALYTVNGIAAGIFYVTHHMIVKTSLFLSAGAMEEIAGSGRLGVARGLASSQPVLAVTFFIPAMALAGLPPLSGFWAKLFLIIAGFDAEAWVSTSLIILVSFFTLASMLKIWSAFFWGTKNDRSQSTLSFAAVAPATVLAVFSVLMGLFCWVIYSRVFIVAEQLKDPAHYISAVISATQESLP